jgi:arabinofuranan 3-O-arabinosyltransferase
MWSRIPPKPPRSLHCPPVRSRPTDRVFYVALAAVSYVPLLLSKPGMVAADTKQYLYLDPGRLTRSAASMWDPNVGLGTVTHQNIGYLFPMGPYYMVVGWLHVPVWVGQRIWMGSLIFMAGLGVAYCARRLGLEGPGRVTASFAYALSPYVIDYVARISAILMPWAALGWMVGLAVSAARTGKWRYPALFALVVALVGGVNATSILLVLVAPGTWLVFAVWGSKEVTLRRAAVAALRITVLSLLVSLWWAAGLWAEGKYGINVLRVTETVPTVSHTSSAAEVLRGLGYWYFYGWDKVQPWTLAAPEYTQSLWLVVLSYLVPAICVLFGFAARWRYRAYAVVLVGIGTVVAVGAFPYGNPSLFGSVLETASAGSTVALALRSVDRIVPIVVLGLALLLGSGLTSLWARWPARSTAMAVLCLAILAADLPPLWSGNLIATNLARPSSLPGYWTQAARYLDSSGSDRVLGLPGEDFAAYSWGVTEDPVASGLITRPYVSRQVVPSGTPASANLVQALDEPLQEGTLDMSALVPVARLMSASQVLLQSDLQFERYHLPLPQYLWQEMTSPQAELGRPVTFGAPNPAKQIRYPLDSELRLGLPTGDPQPPALSVFTVPDPRPLVRAETSQGPIVIAGDGNGVVEAAAAGLLGANQPILYSASLSRPQLSDATAAGATLVLTDTNTLSLQRWGSLRDNNGEVQQPGVKQLATNPSDYSLPVFPGQSTSDQTVSLLSGVKSVTATDYGDSLSFTPENRPANAVDGDTSTAWTYGAHEPAAGGRIEIDYGRRLTAGAVTLIQAQLERPNRRITQVTLRFDGGRPVHVHLTPVSYHSPGQTVTFPYRSFSRLDVTVDAAPGGTGRSYDGLSQVGFAEISLPGVPKASEALRLPTALLASAGNAASRDALDILMNRQRAIEPPRHDPEPQMARVFDLPAARTFTIGGTAEINSGDSDYLINQMIGLTPPPTTSTSAAVVVAANSSTRLDEDRAARANAAVDGNPNTAWIAETGPQAGEWLDVQLNKPVTLDHLNLQVVNDGRHSLPSRITVSTADSSATVDVPVPPVGTGRPQGSTSDVTVVLPRLTGSTIKVTIDAVRQVRALDYYSTFAGRTDILPVGLAELGLPGVVQPAPPVDLPPACQSGLLSIDGRAVDVEITGSTQAAIAGQPLTVEGCGNAAGGVNLAAGPHVLRTSPRLPTGWSIDSLDLASPAPTPPPTPAGAPAVTVDHHDRTSWDLSVHADGKAFWLVLGQSFSKGWQATTSGGRSLGPPQLIDGYATGWLVPAGLIPGSGKVHIQWAPQKVVWAAIGVSGPALLLCALIGVVPMISGLRRRRIGGRRSPAIHHPLATGCLPFSAEAAAAPGPTAAPLFPVLFAALFWAGASAFVSRPVIGIVAGAAVGLGCRLRHGRAGVRGATVVVLLAVPAYVAYQQAAHSYLPTIDWPAAFASANDLAWLGICLLGADVVAGAVRSRFAGPPSPTVPDVSGGGAAHTLVGRRNHQL